MSRPLVRSQSGESPIVLFLLVGISLLGDSAMYSLLPVFADSLGFSLAAVGLILSANRIVRFFTNSVAASLTSRFGYRRLFALALFLGGLVTLGYGLTTNLLLFTLLRMGWGFSWSILRLGAFMAVLKHAGSNGRGEWMGRFRSLSRLGSLTGMIGGGIIADTYGFPVAFRVFGIVILGASAWYVYSIRHMAPETGIQAPDQVHKPGFAAIFNRRMVREWHALALGFVVWLVIGGILTSLVGRLVKIRFETGLALGRIIIGTGTLSGMVVASRFAGELFVGPVGGRLSDRAGRGGFLRLVLVATAIGMIIVISPIPGLLFLAVAVVLLLGSAVIFTVGDALAADTARRLEREGLASADYLGLYTTAVDVGAAAGPLGGYSAGAGLGLSLPFVAGAVLLVAAVPIVSRADAHTVALHGVDAGGQ